MYQYNSVVDNSLEGSLTRKNTDSTLPLKCDECSSTPNVQLSSRQIKERQPDVCSKHAEICLIISVVNVIVSSVLSA